MDLLFGKFEEGVTRGSGAGGDHMLIGVLRRMVESDKQASAHPCGA